MKPRLLNRPDPDNAERWAEEFYRVVASTGRLFYLEDDDTLWLYGGQLMRVSAVSQLLAVAPRLVEFVNEAGERSPLAVHAALLLFRSPARASLPPLSDVIPLPNSTDTDNNTGGSNV